MKLLVLASVFLFGAALAPAQLHSAAHGGPAYGSVGGWGSVAFPGTGHPPASGYVNAGRPYAGRPYGPGFYPGAVRGGNYRRARPVYAYGYPVYVGGGYAEPAYAPAEPPDPGGYPQYGSAMGPPPAPTVIINQNFGPAAPPLPSPETVHVYGDNRPAADNAAPDPQYYLIALKDHSIYSAVAYWVEDGTLHYITTPNIRNETSLNLVDMTLTTRLNQDRGVNVSLPPAR